MELNGPILGPTSLDLRNTWRSDRGKQDGWQEGRLEVNGNGNGTMAINQLRECTCQCR